MSALSDKAWCKPIVKIGASTDMQIGEKIYMPDEPVLTEFLASRKLSPVLAKEREYEVVYKTDAETWLRPTHPVLLMVRR